MQNNVCVSRMITASIVGLPSSRKKDEASKCSRMFQNELSTVGHKLKTLRCSSHVRKFVVSSVIVILHCCCRQYVPEQNGVAEHENRMVVELARSMLSVRLPKLMWAQACEIVAYVLNRMGKTSVIEKSLVEMWNVHVMKKLDHLCVFGTECYVSVCQKYCALA